MGSVEKRGEKEESISGMPQPSVGPDRRTSASMSCRRPVIRGGTQKRAELRSADVVIVDSVTRGLTQAIKGLHASVYAMS